MRTGGNVLHARILFAGIVLRMWNALMKYLFRGAVDCEVWQCLWSFSANDFRMLFEMILS